MLVSCAATITMGVVSFGGWHLGKPGDSAALLIALHATMSSEVHMHRKKLQVQGKRGQVNNYA